MTNPDLAPGARKVVQAAGDPGFSVDYTRQVFRNGKRIRTFPVAVGTPENPTPTGRFAR